MELFIQEGTRTTSDHLKHPDDPMVMTQGEVDVVDYDTELAPYLEKQIKDGVIPELHQDDDNEKLTLVWRSGAGVAVRSMSIMYGASDVPKDAAMNAFQDSLGLAPNSKDNE